MSKTAKTVVLVADDEPSTRALVAGHLRSKGYRVHEAADGDEAWALAHEHLPHIVVLDVMMPGMSGWEVCRKIREAVSLAHTGVVMLTGIGENLNEMTSPLYGADAYLDKPFEFAKLDRKVQETLAKRRPRSSADFVAGIVGAKASKKAKTKAKPSAANSPAKKPVAKKPAPAAKKPGVRPVKKTAAKKTTAKKAAAKKSAPKKAKVAKKQATKKRAAKPTVKKRPVAKKAAKKKSAAKKAPKKRAKPAKKPSKRARPAARPRRAKKA